MLSRREFAKLGSASVLAALTCPGGAFGQTEGSALYVGLPVNDIGNLDPHITVSNSDTPVVQQIYEGLLAFEPGTLDSDKLRPGLATDWTSSDDRKEWIFQLRSGVQWHGGYGEFSAEDVKFSIERIKSEEFGSPFRQTLDNVESVHVEGPLVVRVVLHNSDVNFPALLVNYQVGYIVSKAAIEDGVDLRSTPVGTGPFAFDSYSPRELISLRANGDYWNGAPRLERVIMQFMPDDSSRELAIRSGDIDVTGMPARQITVDRLRSAGINVDLSSVPNNITVHLNLNKPPFDDVRVRRALAHSIDRQIFVDFFGADVASPESSVVAAALVGHTTDTAEYPLDLERARELLAEAGHEGGFTTDVFCSNIDLYLPAMQLIQQQWSRIGVNINLQVVDHPTYHRLIREDASSVVIYSAARYPTTAQIYLEQFFAGPASIGESTAITNFSHYGKAIDGIDDLLEEAKFHSDAEEQARIWGEAQRRIAEDVPAISLYSVKYVLAHTDRVELGYEQGSLPFYRFTEHTRLL